MVHNFRHLVYVLKQSCHQDFALRMNRKKKKYSTPSLALAPTKEQIRALTSDWVLESDTPRFKSCSLYNYALE